MAVRVDQVYEDYELVSDGDDTGGRVDVRGAVFQHVGGRQMGLEGPHVLWKLRLRDDGERLLVDHLFVGEGLLAKVVGFGRVEPEILDDLDGDFAKLQLLHGGDDQQVYFQDRPDGD